jgi:FG-GAP repeat protein
MLRCDAGWRLLGLSALCAIGALGGRVSPSADSSRLVALTPHLSTAAAGFRLGTAGRPFAWSTAVGDLNADGRPDVAVADRIGRGAAGFEYNVQLSISGGGSQSVDFDSDQDALNVALRDVDHDRDLDVVVTGAVSRSIVGIWLNDGTGKFERAAPSPLGFDWSASSADLDGTNPADTAVGEVLPRSSAAAVASRRATGAVRLPAFSLATGGAFRTARASLSALRPRAPPIATA